MVRLAISVEGPTEREFAKQVLVPFFSERNIYAHPIDMGGGISLPKIRGEIRRLIRSFDATTTLYDLYGFGKRDGRSAQDLEAEISALVGNDARLIPYIQQYEFEALMFSAPNVASEVLGNPQVAVGMNQILVTCNNPEAINDGYDTCPSRRLKRLHAGYDKVLHGPQIAQAAGLDVLRATCPRFNQWIIQLENLGK